jgi:hypothetical protein
MAGGCPAGASVPVTTCSGGFLGTVEVGVGWGWGKLASNAFTAVSLAASASFAKGALVQRSAAPDSTVSGSIADVCGFASVVCARGIPAAEPSPAACPRDPSAAVPGDAATSLAGGTVEAGAAAGCGVLSVMGGEGEPAELDDPLFTISETSGVDVAFFDSSLCAEASETGVPDLGFAGAWS